MSLLCSDIAGLTGANSHFPNIVPGVLLKIETTLLIRCDAFLSKRTCNKLICNREPFVCEVSVFKTLLKLNAFDRTRVDDAVE